MHKKLYIFSANRSAVALSVTLAVIFATTVHATPLINPIGAFIEISTPTLITGSSNNEGDLLILPPDGVLTNDVGGVFENNGFLYNFSKLTNNGIVDNNRWLENGGVLENNSDFTNNSEFLNANTGVLENNGVFTNNVILFNEAIGFIENRADLINNLWLDNSGMLHNTGNLTNEEHLENNGTLHNDIGGTLTNNNYLLNEGVLDNDGLITINGFLENRNILNNHGIIDNNVSLYNLGMLTNTGTLTNNDLFGNNATLTNNGDLPNNHQLITNDSFINNDVFDNRAEFTNNGITENTGTFVNNFLATNEGTLRNSGDLTNNGIIENNGTIENSGNFKIVASTIMNGAGNYTQSDGLLVVDGAMSQTNITINGGAIGGRGVISGNVKVNGAAIASGNPPGLLSIVGDMELLGGTTVGLALGGLVGGAFDGYDRIDVVGLLTIVDGTIFDIDYFGAFTADGGLIFDVLVADNILPVALGSLIFDFTGAWLSGGFVWHTSIVDFGQREALRLYVAPDAFEQVPEPRTALLFILGLAGMSVMRRHRCDHSAHCR